MCAFCEDIPEWSLIESHAGDEDLPDYYLVKMDNKYCLYQNSKYADFTEVALDDIKFCPYCGKSLKEEALSTLGAVIQKIDDSNNIYYIPNPNNKPIKFVLEKVMKNISRRDWTRFVGGEEINV